MLINLSSSLTFIPDAQFHVCRLCDITALLFYANHAHMSIQMDSILKVETHTHSQSICSSGLLTVHNPCASMHCYHQGHRTKVKVK